MRGLIFWKNYSKKILLLLIVLILTGCLALYLVNKEFYDYFKYEIPKNLIAVEYNDKLLADNSTVITDYQFTELEDLKSNIRGIDLGNISFIKDNSNKMKKVVQTKLNNGTKSQKQVLKFMSDAKVLNEWGINIPLLSLDVDHIVVGDFPEVNQVMISEVFATEIINNSVEYKSYNDLVGQTIDNYSISGIYKSLENTEVDEIIKGKQTIDPNESKMLLIDSPTEEQFTVIDESNLVTFSYKDFNNINFGKIFSVMVILSIILLLEMGLIKETKQFIGVCNNHHISRCIFILNIINPIIFLCSVMIIFILTLNS